MVQCQVLDVRKNAYFILIADGVLVDAQLHDQKDHILSGVFFESSEVLVDAFLDLILLDEVLLAVGPLRHYLLDLLHGEDFALGAEKLSLLVFAEGDCVLVSLAQLTLRIFLALASYQLQ